MNDQKNYDQEIIEAYASALEEQISEWRKTHGTIKGYKEIIEAAINSAYYSGKASTEGFNES